MTGVSGSGKTTLVLKASSPAEGVTGRHDTARACAVRGRAGHRTVDLVDATPIGVNVRSTVGTYSGVLDDLRRAFAALPDAKEQGLKAGAFSYNTGSLRCPTCDGTGQISLDVQFLPDVDIPCPDCRGSRYGGRPTPSKWPSKATSNRPPTPKWSATRPMSPPPMRAGNGLQPRRRFRKRAHFIASRGAHSHR